MRELPEAAPFFVCVRGGVGRGTLPASVYRLIRASKFDVLMNAHNSLRSNSSLRTMSTSSLRGSNQPSKGNLQSPSTHTCLTKGIKEVLSNLSKEISSPFSAHCKEPREGTFRGVGESNRV